MAKDYPRNKGGQRLQIGGMDTVHPPDKMPPNKYPFLQNVRAYLRDRIAGRATQDSSVLSYPSAVHSLRRLNDTTPHGPASGYVLIVGAGQNLYAQGTECASGLSGNPLSLIPFRPNASVQPWMYVGDSQLTGVYIGADSSPNGMLKVRSDGLCYSMGIEEPQAAPVVTFTPISNVVSLVGNVVVWAWDVVSFSGLFIWRNPTDSGPSNSVETTATATLSSTGNSLQFNSTPSAITLPIQWTNYLVLIGTVNTAGTAVTWVSGNQFGAIVAGDTVIINTISYTVAASPAPTATTFSVTVSAGTQTGLNYYAAVPNGTLPLFSTPIGSTSDYIGNFAILATLYIPAAGSYTLSVSYETDIIWGIGGNASGTPTWVNNYPVSGAGQTKSMINGDPLLPRNTTTTSGVNNTSVSVYFPAPGNYPIEIDWVNAGVGNTNSTMVVECSGQQIAPLPATIITDAQYRYTYRSSATGATSNPSPASPEQSLSVLSNNATTTPSTDPQVDKIDWYRLDTGLENFTYVGTTENETVNTVTTGAVVVTGFQYVPLASYANVVGSGQSVTIDTGVNQETVVILSIRGGVHHRFTGIGAVFTMTHISGVPVTSPNAYLNDTLLDTEVAGNPLLEYDNYQPFPSIDLPHSGIVNVDSGTVTWVSGDQFNVRWLGGTGIIIGTVPYTLDKRPTSSTTLTASYTETVGGFQLVVPATSGSLVPYEIAEPLLAAQPLPYLWGPTDNVNFVFGCGDPTNPGVLYWCKGNNLDAAPDTNQQNVTSPSEPLQNGCIVNGLGMVYSISRAWLIYPNFFNANATVTGTEGSTWTLQESPLKRGLYIPRCLAVEGGGTVFFRAKDGVYASPGGSGGKSITDEDLYNLFPHEGMVPQPVTIGGFTVYPPDDTQQEAQKFACANGYLYYDYKDASGTPRTLVYDIGAGGWVWDVYQYPAISHALEEGPNVNGTLTGNLDGSVRALTNTGAEVAVSVVLTPSEVAGDVRAPKHWADIYIEAEQGE